jgi:hypothetical protein
MHELSDERRVAETFLIVNISLSSQNTPSTLWNPNLDYYVQNFQPFIPDWSQMNPLHALQPHRFNLLGPEFYI